MIHTMEKSYHHSNCDNPFLQNDILIIHLLTTGEETYQSSQCDKAFKGKMKHITHQNNSHLETPFSVQAMYQAFHGEK